MKQSLSTPFQQKVEFQHLLKINSIMKHQLAFKEAKPFLGDAKILGFICKKRGGRR